MTHKLKIGDIVKFSEGLYSDEIGSFYRIIEVNQDRVIIEYICDLPFPPQSVAKIDDLELATNIENAL